MPLDPISAGLGSAALQSATGPLQTYLQQRYNQKNYRQTRQDALQDYNTQRIHALQDWNMQNKYNSPEEQMRRLTKAGLNPNLVYGNGAVGNTSSGVDQSQIRQSNLAPTQVDLSGIGNAVNSYMNVQSNAADLALKQQQTDNLKANNELLKQAAVMNSNKIITQELDNYIKGKSKEDIIKSFSLKNQATSQKTSLDFAKTNLTTKDVENYDKSLSYTLAYKKALTQNLYNSITNRDMITNSQVQLNAAKLLLTKAQQGKIGYDNYKSFYDALKVIKETGWLDDINKMRVATGYTNAAGGLFQKLTDPLKKKGVYPFKKK